MLVEEGHSKDFQKENLEKFSNDSELAKASLFFTSLPIIVAKTAFSTFFPLIVLGKVYTNSIF